MSSSAMNEVARTGPGGKIGPHHRERLAVVYIRQSTAYQVSHHQESTKLQYGLKQHAMELGWTAERILVIDEDLGSSGASAEGRAGFQRLMAEVGLDNVGIIFGIEVSRLARSCRDWYHLLEVCALFRTLISDSDGVYDPCNYNDRLLLGLKGTMSEAELHILKQRMLAGRWAKAKRGELGMAVPIGYVRKPSGEVIKDPDEQVQATIALLFEQFASRGSVTRLLRHLVDNGIKLPGRIRSGPRMGELSWQCPNRRTLHNLLHNPAYAGAYVYGRRVNDPRAQKAGRPHSGKVVTKMSEWEVCLRDRLPAYISWEQFEANQRQLRDNQSRARGAVRHGEPLLSGLVVCGRCGHRMYVSFSGGYPRYSCCVEKVVHGGDLCQSLATQTIDATVAEWALRALEPASLEISLAAAAALEQERARLAGIWRQRLERAEHEIERGMREYQLVEPENRLVKRTLERQLEERLADQQRLQEEYRRWLSKQPTVLTAQEREAIQRLATDIPALWSAPTTTTEQKKIIVRQLIERVRLTVVGDTERVLVAIEWVGGHRTETEATRPVKSTKQLSYHERLIHRIELLRKEGNTYKAIATCLNKEGWRPPKRRKTFNEGMVYHLLSRSCPPTELPKLKHFQPRLSQHEWTVPALAEKLGMPTVTLHRWVQKENVTARKVLSEGGQGALVILADAAEIKRLRALRATSSARRPRRRSSTL
jgi:DNA invertase Pin-like site-specific DNA recombinase